LIFGVLALAWTHRAVTPTGDYQFLATAWSWAKSKPPRTWVHAWFVAFGPMLSVVIFAWRRCLPFLWAHQDQLFLLVACAALAWLGGSDTERILYWSMPVVYLLMGVALEAGGATGIRDAPEVPSAIEADGMHEAGGEIEARDAIETGNAIEAPGAPEAGRGLGARAVLRGSRSLLATLLIGQALMQRLFWTVPDYPGVLDQPMLLLAPLGNHFDYFELFSFHGSPSIGSSLLIQDLLFTAVLVGWMRVRARGAGSDRPGVEQIESGDSRRVL
jgi:hypothetical protein